MSSVGVEKCLLRLSVRSEGGNPCLEQLTSRIEVLNPLVFVDQSPPLPFEFSDSLLELALPRPRFSSINLELAALQVDPSFHEMVFGRFIEGERFGQAFNFIVGTPMPYQCDLREIEVDFKSTAYVGIRYGPKSFAGTN